LTLEVGSSAYLFRYCIVPATCKADHRDLFTVLSNAVFQLRRQLTLNCDSVSSDTCSGFTAVSPADRAIIISFRFVFIQIHNFPPMCKKFPLIFSGTTAFLQLVQEFNFAQKVTLFNDNIGPMDN
jgi:hypothetical protein